MAGTIVVGRVAIRVYPDTKKFRGDLQGELKAIPDVKVVAPVEPKVDQKAVDKAKADLEEKFHDQTLKLLTALDESKLKQTLIDLKAKMAAFREKITLGIDFDQLKTLGALRAIQEQMHAALKDLRVKLMPTVNPSDILPPLAKIKAMLAQGIDVILNLDDTYVLPAVTAIRTKVAAILGDVRLRIMPTVEPSDVLTPLTKIKAMLAKGIDIMLKPDVATTTIESIKSRLVLAFSNIRARIFPNLENVKAEEVLKSLKHKYNKITAKVKPELVAREAWLVLAQIKTILHSVQVKIKPVMDNKALAKVMTSLAAISGMRMGQDMFSNMWDKVKNLDKEIPKLLALIPAIATLGAAIMNLGGNLVSLIYGLGQIGPIVLALPSLLLGAAAGLYSFYFAFKDLKTVFPELSAWFSKLHVDMSAKFWDAAKNPMGKFFTVALPKFKTGMLALSEANGRLLGGIADGFTKNAGPAMDQFFKGLITYTDNWTKAGPAIGGLMSSFMTIGADLLPRIGKGLADATERLDDWFKKNTENGKVVDWIELAWTRLGELWRVLTGLVDLTASLGRAIDAVGGTSLKSLGDTLHQWADDLASPENQKKLGQMFEGAGKAMDNFWANARAGAADVWGSFASSLNRNLPSLGASLGTLLGSIFEGTSLSVFQSGLKDMVDGISETLDKLKKPITNFVGSLGGLGTLIGRMMVAFAPIIGFVLDTVSQIIDKLAGPLGDFMETITTNLTPILDDLKPFIGEMLDKFAQNLPEIGKALGDMLRQVKPLVDLIGPAVVEQWKIGFDVLSVVIIGLAQIIGGVSTAIVWLSDRFNEFLAWLSGTALPAVGKFGTDVGNAIQDGLASVFGEDGLIAKITGWIDRNIVQPVKNFLGIHSPSTVFTEIGVNIVQGLIGGISALVGLLGSAIGSLVQSVVDGGRNMASGFVGKVTEMKNNAVAGLIALKNGAIDALNQLIPGAGTAMNNFGSRVSQGVSDAMSTLGGIGARAVSAVGDLGGKLWSAGSGLLQGLIDGINRRIGDVKGVLNWLTSAMPSWKGPYEKDRTLFTPIGETLMQSLIDGLKSGADEVHAYLSDFTTDLGNTEFAATLSANRNVISTIEGSGANGSQSANGPTIKVTNYYPQAEPTSRTVNRALELATLL